MVLECAVIGRGSQVLYDVTLEEKGFRVCCDWPTGITRLQDARRLPEVGVIRRTIREDGHVGLGGGIARAKRVSRAGAYSPAQPTAKSTRP
jgi:hypothetical protein